MPSIDVHAAANLFSEQDERALAAELAAAALRAEGGWGLAGRTGARLVEWAMERAASAPDTPAT
ncbi:hypothetical protein KGQ20_29250 [Catenulispora sp. NF23]|uniref:Uncharacterized protein n=1 Tax=Catenulispora pinistramenti TaxID=2705254 RepID=A0ABS5L470_9ACTN|nr:hypothetical protein [Catenulispora pinistramenti]MBS2536857.1 hypothetical protein [Catenulispora pinistramenti]MBS2552929.1 hypothetical protein [Catenulispora pinistramenti]